MKKTVVAFLLIILLILSISSCSSMHYDEKDFLGKTSLQIEAQFGKFDNHQSRADDDGLYKCTKCGYRLTPDKRGLWGTPIPGKYYMISFDENGVAHECQIETGGWGG